MALYVECNFFIYVPIFSALVFINPEEFHKEWWIKRKLKNRGKKCVMLFGETGLNEGWGPWLHTFTPPSPFEHLRMCAMCLLSQRGSLRHRPKTPHLLCYWKEVLVLSDSTSTPRPMESSFLSYDWLAANDKANPRSWAMQMTWCNNGPRVWIRGRGHGEMVSAHRAFYWGPLTTLATARVRHWDNHQIPPR